MSHRVRVFATCDIGDALNLLRNRGYEVEVYPHPEAPPKSLIIDKVKSGVDGLITTLRDPIDAEIFGAGKGTLKVVAQIAVGFDNINRADANRYKIPFTHTADVLTEATAEFAFFLMGALARKLWPAEHLTRENRWGYWHPYLPFLGDEVTGKTVAVIGTGRIGLALIKKCAGFDMNILCFDPAYENHDYIRAIQEVKDLRFQRGISRERATIRYTTTARSAEHRRLHQPARAVAARRRERNADLSPDQRNNAAHDEADGDDHQHLARPGSRRGSTGSALRENWIAGAALDVYEKEPLPARFAAARSRDRRPLPLAAALRQRRAESPACPPIPTKAWPAAACKD